MTVTNTDKLYYYCIIYCDKNLENVRGFEGIIARPTYYEAVQAIEEEYKDYYIITIEIHRTYFVFNEEAIELLLNS